jgi:hypothetical protein
MSTACIATANARQDFSMIAGVPAPTPDELVESLFFEVLLPPEGYEYHGHDGQILFPTMDGRWRLVLHKKQTQIAKENLFPIFLDGAFILKLTKALHAMQRELNHAVTDNFPEPVTRMKQ